MVIISVLSGAAENRAEAHVSAEAGWPFGGAGDENRVVFRNNSLVQFDQGVDWRASVLLRLQEHMSEVLQSENHASTLLLGHRLALLPGLHQVDFLGVFQLLAGLLLPRVFNFDPGLTRGFRKEKIQSPEKLALFEFVARDCTILESHQLADLSQDLSGLVEVARGQVEDAGFLAQLSGQPRELVHEPKLDLGLVGELPEVIDECAVVKIFLHYF